ncbi:unnamed protein product [Mytilus coruscus]|uniref:Uncharacterized protein n=1 Tax=Mytilus coruscus TaxID=42192 RepID=A0A6J8CXC1_MYTCO|nr:unnamed protein product [Mytilus coruscus]
MPADWFSSKILHYGVKSIESNMSGFDKELTMITVNTENHRLLAAVQVQKQKCLLLNPVDHPVRSDVVNWLYNFTLFLYSIEIKKSPMDLGQGLSGTLQGTFSHYRKWEDNEATLRLKTHHSETVMPINVALEKEGLIRALKWVGDNNLSIKTLVTDQHLQIGKYFRESELHIKHYFEVWHVAKASTPAGHGEEMVSKWLSVANHVQNIHTDHSDTFPSCKHRLLVGRNRKKKWLKPAKSSSHSNVPQSAPNHQELQNKFSFKFHVQRILFSGCRMQIHLYMGATIDQDEKAHQEKREPTTEGLWKIKGKTNIFLIMNVYG